MKIKEIIFFLTLIAPFLVWADDLTIKLNQQGDIVYCSQPVFIAPNLNIDGSLAVTSMKVSISVGYFNGEDELLPPSNPGPITAVWNAQLGSMTLTGSSNINDYVLAIRQIMYRDRRTTPITGKRTITISLADAEYFPTNQHYYIFIDKPGITWTAAKAEAESPAMKYHGLQGYLATITSSGENTFIRQKTKGVGWIGATDQAIEGDWRWVTGPEGLEDGGQGRYFWRGTGYDAKSNPASYGPVGGAYHNWNKWNIRYTATTPKNTWEPTNQTGNEDYAHITLFPKDMMNSYKWNDYPNAEGTGDYLPAGYLIEYGGMPGDPIINLSADLTIQVSSIVFSPIRVYSRCQGTAGQINIRDNSATYSWLPTTGLSDPHISNPIAKPDVSTEYTVVASNGTCKDSAKFTVNINPLPVSLLNDKEIICSGTKLTLDPGLHSAYLWDNKATTRTIVVSTAGKYIVRLTSNKGCTLRDTVTVTVQPAPKMDLSGMNRFICGSKATTLKISKDKGEWLITNLFNNQKFTTPAIQVAAYGNYPFNLKLSDPNGCSVDTTVTISFYDIPIVNLGRDTAICISKSIILNAGIGFDSYLWSTKETTAAITVKNPGTYSVFVKDKNNCSAKDSIQISNAERLLIDLSGVDTLVCGLKSTKVNIKTDLSKYRLTAKDSTINIDGMSVSVTKYGSYQFSLVSTNKSSCSSDTSFTIGFHEAPTVNLGKDTTICNPNTITLDAGTGYSSCLWSTRDTSRTILVKKTGIYNVFIKNKYNCSASDTIKIGLVDKMKVDLSSLDTLVCGFKSTNFNIKVELDKYNLKSKDPTTVIDGLSASVPKFGTYPFDLIATDHSGCYSDTSFTVSFHEAPSVNLGNDTTICGTNSIVLNAGAGFSSYLWSTQETTPTILAKKSGTYSVLIKNNYNCTASDTLKIGLVDSKIDLSGLDTLICGQKATQLNIKAAAGKYLLKSNNSSVAIDGMSVSVSNYGTYPFAIVAVEKSSCFSDSSFTVSFREAPTINLGNDTMICNPKAILLNAGAGFSSYLWSTKETTSTIFANKAGLYSVVVKNKYNCSATDVIRISQVDSMKVDLSRLDTLICGSKVTSVNINFEPGKYLLQSKDASVRIDGMTATVPKFGSYPFTLVAADKTSCYAESDFKISFQDVPAVNLGNDTILCNPKTITLNAGTGFTSYLWSTFETTPTIKVTTSGIYRVLVRNKFNCTASDTINIGFVDNMKADLSGLDTLICGTKVSTINVQPEKGKYILSSRDLSVKIDGMTATVPQNGIYPFTLVATDKSSCYVDVSFNLNFKQPPIVSFTLDSTTCQGYSFDAKYSGNADIGRTKFTWILANDTLENGIGKDRISVNYGAIPMKKDLTLLVNERGCMNQSPIQQINMIPGLNFTVSDTLLCEPSAFVFSTISTKKVVDFLWDWGDGTVDQLGVSPATHKYSKVGKYSVQLTATTDKGCIRTIKKDSLLYYAPTPTVAFSMKENQCLDLGSHTIYDQGSGGVNDRYIWDLSSLLPADLVKNPGSTKGPLIFDLKSVPSARIGLQVISKDGCASEKKTMLLQRKPLFSIQAKDSSGCAPFTATLISVTADPIDQVDYSWNFGDGKLATGVKVSHTYSSPNKIYDITLAAKSRITGCRDTLFKPKFIRVYPNPAAAFKVDLRTLGIGNLEAVFANQSVNAVHYKWTFDDGSISELKVQPINMKG